LHKAYDIPGRYITEAGINKGGEGYSLDQFIHYYLHYRTTDPQAAETRRIYHRQTAAQSKLYSYND